jgi:hypothetical protein
VIALPPFGRPFRLSLRASSTSFKGPLRQLADDSVNLLLRLLRRGRLAAFPAVFADSLQQLSDDATASALVSAADYCLSVRVKGDSGRLVAARIEDPRQLSKGDAEHLYFNLEGLYIGAMRCNVAATEMRAMAGRYGQEFAEQYRERAERSTRALAIGYGILMIRLLARMRDLEASALEPIQERLSAAVNGVDLAVERVAAAGGATANGSGIVWPPDVAGYLRETAKVLARVSGNG